MKKLVSFLLLLALLLSLAACGGKTPETPEPPVSAVEEGSAAAGFLRADALMLSGGVKKDAWYTRLHGTQSFYTARVGETDTFWQVFGLDDLAGNAYMLNLLNDTDGVELFHFHSGADGAVWKFFACYVQLRVIMETALTALPYYGAPGFTATVGEEWKSNYTVLEQEADSVLFLREEDDFSYLGRAVQMDGFVLEVSARQFQDYEDGNTVVVENDDPRDEAVQTALRTLLDELFGAHLAVASGVSEEESAALLPTSLVFSAGGEQIAESGFTIPNSRLTEISPGVLRAVFTDADGTPYALSMENGPEQERDFDAQVLAAWGALYEENRETPEEKWSALFGIPVVPCGDGGTEFLIRTGRYQSDSLNYIQYYKLTIEAL